MSKHKSKSQKKEKKRDTKSLRPFRSCYILSNYGKQLKAAGLEVAPVRGLQSKFVCDARDPFEFILSASRAVTYMKTMVDKLAGERILVINPPPCCWETADEPAFVHIWVTDPRNEELKARYNHFLSSKYELTNEYAVLDMDDFMDNEFPDPDDFIDPKQAPGGVKCHFSIVGICFVDNDMFYTSQQHFMLYDYYLDSHDLLDVMPVYYLRGQLNAATADLNSSVNAEVYSKRGDLHKWLLEGVTKDVMLDTDEEAIHVATLPVVIASERIDTVGVKPWVFIRSYFARQQGFQEVETPIPPIIMDMAKRFQTLAETGRAKSYGVKDFRTTREGVVLNHKGQQAMITPEMLTQSMQYWNQPNRKTMSEVHLNPAFKQIAHAIPADKGNLTALMQLGVGPAAALGFSLVKSEMSLKFINMIRHSIGPDRAAEIADGVGSDWLFPFEKSIYKSILTVTYWNEAPNYFNREVYHRMRHIVKCVFLLIAFALGLSWLVNLFFVVWVGWWQAFSPLPFGTASHLVKCVLAMVTTTIALPFLFRAVRTRTFGHFGGVISILILFSLLKGANCADPVVTTGIAISPLGIIICLILICYCCAQRRQLDEGELEFAESHRNLNPQPYEGKMRANLYSIDADHNMSKLKKAPYDRKVIKHKLTVNKRAVKDSNPAVIKVVLPVSSYKASYVHTNNRHNQVAGIMTRVLLKLDFKPVIISDSKFAQYARNCDFLHYLNKLSGPKHGMQRGFRFLLKELGKYDYMPECHTVLTRTEWFFSTMIFEDIKSDEKGIYGFSERIASGKMTLEPIGATVMDTPSYLKRYNSQRRKILEGIYTRLQSCEYDYVHKRDGFYTPFVKVEKENLAKAFEPVTATRPRQVMAMPDRWKIIYGPIFKMWTDFLHEKFHWRSPICFAGGFTAAETARWFQFHKNSIKEGEVRLIVLGDDSYGMVMYHGKIYFFCTDYSKFDLTQSIESKCAEAGWYYTMIEKASHLIEFGHLYPKSRQQFLACELIAKIMFPDLDREDINHVVHLLIRLSGSLITCNYNSLRNICVHLGYWVLMGYKTFNRYSKAAEPAPPSAKSFESWALDCGLSVKVSFSLNPTRVEFCSGRFYATKPYRFSKDGKLGEELEWGFGRKPGRMLAKFGFALQKYRSIEELLQCAHGSVISMQSIGSFVPFLREYLDVCEEYLRKTGVAIKFDDEALCRMYPEAGYVVGAARDMHRELKRHLTMVCPQISSEGWALFQLTYGFSEEDSKEFGKHIEKLLKEEGTTQVMFKSETVRLLTEVDDSFPKSEL